MTQEVQPLTWSKRTNIEEHQQFFSKINEIIGNLAPTVNEAEAAIAQATAAVATANDASAAASAAASQAQTAASTVAGYDGRLTAAEGDIDAAEGDITALQGRMGTAEGNITALQNVQADYVKKAGAAQTVTSQIMVPTTATGVRDAQIANGTRIQNDLAAYEPMVRTTGNQNISGVKKFTGSNVKVQGGISFNDADAENDLVRGSVFSTTPTLFLRSYSQLKDNEFAEMRVSCNRTETQITFGLYLLSYQNVNGTAELVDYHPIYEKVVTL